MALTFRSTSPLGIPQILCQSILLFLKAGQLLLPIFLLSVLSSSLLFYCYYSIAPIPLDLADKISILLKETKHRPPNLVPSIVNDLKSFAALAPPIALFSFFSSLFLSLSSIYTFAAAYTDTDLTPDGLLHRIARRWYQTMVTRLYAVLLAVGIALLSSFALVSVALGSLSDSIFLAFLVTFLYLYLSTRWRMSLVIATVEETWGIGALSWAVNLYLGNKKRGVALTAMMVTMKVAIYGALLIGLVMASDPTKQTRMCMECVVAVVDAAWNLYTMAVYTVFYYECRKSHGLDSIGSSAVLVRVNAVAY
ncbi:uncharacterized protein LOC122022402 [Zingiber officinale]|uniref:uncharacterized protein LOC122022402 n=1 Tax=Zingiber officinale TaxID=94328 RepID=UPI001C4CB8D3|nr:uncharacterized protein LOC122022402 [Zingiber officinale]